MNSQTTLRLDEINKILFKSGFSIRNLLQSFFSFKPENSDQKKVLQFCKKYSLPFWILLIGAPGAGKDHLLSAIIRLLVGTGQIKSFWAGSLTKFLREFRARAFQQDNANEIEAFEWATGFDLLCFRDIATRDLSSFEKGLLIDIFDFYYENSKPIFASGNIRPDQFSAYLDQRILDRFFEMSKPFENLGYIPCSWESFRKNFQPVPDEIRRLLTQMPPEPADWNGKLIAHTFCDACGKPEGVEDDPRCCKCIENLSDSEMLNFVNEHYKRIYIPDGFDPRDYAREIQNRKRDDSIWEELKRN